MSIATVTHHVLRSAFFSASRNSCGRLASALADIVESGMRGWQSLSGGRRTIFYLGSVKSVQTSCRISVPGASLGNVEKEPPKFLRDKKVVPDADPLSSEDVDQLYQFFDQSTKLIVLTGAGISTECGIPDYRRFYLFFSFLDKLVVDRETVFLLL